MPLLVSLSVSASARLVALAERHGATVTIVEPREADPIRADRDHVVLLSDWTDEDPMRVLAKLKAQSDYYNFNQPTAIDFFRDVADMGLSRALDKRAMWNHMRMNPTDLADLSGATLT